MEVTTMRGILIELTLGIGLSGISCLLAQPAATESDKNITKQPSWIQSLDIDKLDPKTHDPRLHLLLRCEDIPRAKRIEYARRYLRGEYAHAPKGKIDGQQAEAYSLLLEEASQTLAHLNDIDSIPLIEAKLKEWEENREKSFRSPVTEVLILPDLGRVKAALARLKAVRDIPQVKTADDLIHRLKRMLTYIGFDGSVQEWLKVLVQEIDERKDIDHAGIGPHEWLLHQYGHQLMEAGWNGVNIDPAAQIVQLSIEDAPWRRAAQTQFEVYVELAKVPRDRLAQWIVDDAMNWQGIGIQAESKCQMLVDMGMSVVPIVWEKLLWALRHRDQIKGNGMGLVALLEVLVTLGGEQALPLIEPFTQDENKWVRHYACRAKEYIQQGKVFLFAPYF
jgi:hypothetical protein